MPVPPPGLEIPSGVSMSYCKKEHRQRVKVRKALRKNRAAKKPAGADGTRRFRHRHHRKAFQNLNLDTFSAQAASGHI